ncbi:MAG: hypothetical protein JNM10_18340 [Planctomycetia bacterium]|nr:hypothetical protein [Planctomycetia bacterium]
MTVFRALARWWRRRRAAPSVSRTSDVPAGPAGDRPGDDRRRGLVVPVPEFDGRLETHVREEHEWTDRSRGDEVQRVIPAYVETIVHVDRACRPAVAVPGQRRRCSETPVGDFYTDCDSCLTCSQFALEAPDLIAYVKHPDTPEGALEDMHCAFVRQPRTPEEVERAIDAMCGSEVCGIRYGGRDPEILRRIAARGTASDGAADHLLG